MSNQATVLLSGGIDSAACARYLQAEYEQIKGLFVDYGQAAARHELHSAEALSRLLSITLLTARYESLQSYGSGEILGRNAFLVFAALMAAPGPGVIDLGIHEGTRYYDCTLGFLASVDRLVAEYTDGCIRVIAPFISWSKRRVFEYYVSTGFPAEIAYSCEAGTDPPCGLCSSCLDRRTLNCTP